jgi:hypothetical protein
MRRPITIAFATCALIIGGCGYIVVPPDDGSGGSASSKGWSALVTEVATAASGELRVSLSVRNDTAAWSAMEATAGQPAVLTAGDGKTVQCATVVVGTGGHRVAPGLRLRGFVVGQPAQPTTEPIRVECAGATAGPGARLAIDYSYVTGEYNYYEPDANTVTAKLEVDLDKVVTDLTYPVAEPVAGVPVPPDTEMTGINDVTLRLVGVERTASSLRSTWRTTNPGAYPSYVHIGNPPVIGSDGVVYGTYESPDIATVPVTPAGGTAEWATEVAVPSEVTGLIMLLSVESKKARTFVNYAIDLSSK